MQCRAACRRWSHGFAHDFKATCLADLKVVGYWVPEGAPDCNNTFIFLIAHSSPEEAKKNWDAMRSDPEFQEMIKSEQANKLVEKVEVTYMRPTDFSPIK